MQQELIHSGVIKTSDKLKIGTTYTLKFEEYCGSKMQESSIPVVYYGLDKDGWMCFYDDEDKEIIKLEPRTFTRGDAYEGGEYSLDVNSVGTFVKYNVYKIGTQIKIQLEMNEAYMGSSSTTLHYEQIAKDLYESIRIKEKV